MRVKSFIVAIVALVALLVVAAASASPCPPKHSRPPHGKSCGPLFKYDRFTGECVAIPPSTSPPQVTPPPGTNPPPSTTPPPVTVTVTPPSPPSVPVEFFCVQTKERGETAVQAYEGAFNAGGAWRNLAIAGATLNIAGHVVTLMWENGAGVIVAPVVPGRGATCDQPEVSTDGKVLHPEYLKGLAPILPIVVTVSPA